MSPKGFAGSQGGGQLSPLAGPSSMYMMYLDT